jgi:hypothetical protein
VIYEQLFRLKYLLVVFDADLLASMHLSFVIQSLAPSCTQFAWVLALTKYTNIWLQVPIDMPSLLGKYADYGRKARLTPMRIAFASSWNLASGDNKDT